MGDATDETDHDRSSPSQMHAPGAGDPAATTRLRNDVLLIVAGVGMGWRLHASPTTAAATAALIGIGLIAQRGSVRTAAAIRTDLIHLGISTALLDIAIGALVVRLGDGCNICGLPIPIQAFSLFVLIDLLSYATHRLMHTWRVPWAFHKAHHAPGGLDVLVAFRRHPVGELIQRVPILAAVLLLGPDPLVTIGVFGFFTVWGIAIHANWDPPGSGWIPCLVTPARHLHHHRSGTRANYGGVLLVWDRVFGTYEPLGDGDQSIGETGTPEDWWAQFAEPFELLRPATPSILRGRHRRR